MSIPAFVEVNHVIVGTITDILGGPAASVFFQQLEKREGVTLSEAAERPQAVSGVLREFFGSGGPVIEGFDTRDVVGAIWSRDPLRRVRRSRR